jgi:hypothetical protein
MSLSNYFSRFASGFKKKNIFVKRRYIPSALIFLISLIALIPIALTQPQHGDEAMYIWKAAYYTNRISHLEFASQGSDDYTDPGFSPLSFWAMEQPFGSHIIYAIAMKLSNTSAPSVPYKYLDPAFQKPENLIPASTLPVVRIVAVLCVSIGLGLIVYRFGWSALGACLLFIAIPHVRFDLSRAYAEGPLLLGFGLCAVLAGTRFYGSALGLTASFKLTGILLWPIAGYASRKLSRPKQIRGALACLLTWSITNPLSWFAGGPLYLFVLLFFRIASLFWQSKNLHTDIIAGWFFPSRYWWPFELAFLLLIFVRILPICLQLIRSRRNSAV